MKKPLTLLTFLAIAGCAAAQLATPTLSSPSNNLATATVRQNLQWSRIAAATGYTFQIDTSASFNSPMLYEASQAQTSSTPQSRYHSYLHYNTNYYWRVRAYNATDTSAWSAVWTFHTDISPYLTSPSNDTNPNSTYYTRITFGWNKFYGSSGYTLQVDTTPLFSSPLLRNVEVSSSITNTDNLTQVVNHLHYGTRYYWRVRAYHQDDTSGWSAVRQFHTQYRPTLYSPNNDTNPASTYYTRIYFQWNNARGSTSYTLQVDTVADFSSPLLRTLTTTSSVSNTDTYIEQVVSHLHYGTHYYWRVRAINANDTSDWSLTRQFYTQYRPTLYSPDNNTNPNSTYYTRIYFSWNNARGSTSYTLQVDTTADFSSPLLRTLTTTSSVSNTDTYIEQVVSHLHYGTHYYWRVRAINSNDTSDWSLTRQLYTQYRPTLYSPSEGATGLSTRIYFSWNNARGSTSYTLQVDTTADFSSPLLRTLTTTSSVSNTDTYIEQVVNYLHYGTHYYWRVRAVNSNDTSDWSAVRQFTTSARPTLYSPSNNNATGQSVSSLYLYFYNHRGSTSYRVQLDTTPLFNSQMLRTLIKTISVTNTDNTLYTQLSNLRYGTAYYWRVQAIHQNDSSQWSQTWRFWTTYNNVYGPSLATPVNDSVGVAHNAAILTWQPLANMTGYRYWVSTTSSFADTIAMGTTSLTFTNIATLYPSSTYYWRVQGIYATGMTNYSDTWHFTTADIPLSAPQLVSPADHGNVQQASVTLAWQSVYGALTYQVQFSLDSAFQTAVSSYTTADTHYNLGGLPLNMNYYWRVRSANNNAVSAWSAAWTFNTNNCIPTFATIDTAICEGNSYWFFGTALSATDTYSHTLPNAAGCDSTVTLHLTVHPRGLNGSVADTACDSYLWHGLTYTQSGNYPYYTQTTHGCDSLAVLHLTLHHSATGSETFVGCDSFNWHGTTYTQTGDYPYYTQTTHGCDSLVTLHLTLHHSATGSETFVGCDSFSWHGTTYTQTGDYPYYTQTTHGCDSLVTLHLTILRSTAGTDEQTACDSLTWIDGITYYSSTSNSQFTIPNSVGCDSLVTLHLTINSSFVSHDTVEVRDSYDWNGTTYTESGDYTYTATTAFGCDSIVTLHLVILRDSTGIASLDALGIKISTTPDGITITGAQGLPVAIYDLTGRLLRRDIPASDQFTIHNSQFSISAGAYLLRIASLPATKVVLLR